MDFKVAKKLGYKIDNVIHIGAHKFEEAPEYTSFGTERVVWIDPIIQVDPARLPPGQLLLKIAVGNVKRRSKREFKIFNATGFSSFLELDKPGSIIRGTPKLVDILEVEIESLRRIQASLKLEQFSTLVIDTQGSEYEILMSADLNTINEIVIETSRKPLYKGEKKHSEINEFLILQGFHHNFNDSDYIYGHGDQYYSRKKNRIVSRQVIRRIFQTYRFCRSLVSRISIGLTIRIK